MRVKTTTGQMAMVGGDLRDQAGGILVEERSVGFARGRDRGYLYVLVDVSGEEAGRDIIAGQLAGVVRDVYYGWRGSVTAGLQQALREANSLLFDENRNSLPGDRRTAGVSCVVLRGGDLFVGQVGPTAVYLAHKGQVTRFPDVSPWLDGIPPEDMEAAALGERRDVNVLLFHAQVEEGDTLLLVESDLAHHASPHKWPSILNRTTIGAVLDGVQVAGEGSDLSALVVMLGGERSEAKTVQPVPANGAPRVSEPPSPSTVEQFPLWLSQLRLGERLGTVIRAVSVALAGIWASLLGLLRRLVPGQGGLAEAGSRQPAVARRSDKMPKRAPRTRKKSRAPGEHLQKILLGVAVAIPLIVAIVVLVVFLQRGQAQRAELEALWQDASAYWDQAQVSSEPTVARTLLIKAETSLEQLLERQPDHAEAVELQKKVEARLDVINRVQRVSWIAELRGYPAGADLTRVVVKGVHVFVMDRHNNKVYHHQLDETQKALIPDLTDPVLLSKGDQVGETLVADLVDMVWMPTGPGRQKEALLILESGGTLIEYDPTTGELLSLRVADSTAWTFPELVGSYYGRFYVLDSAANEIWRYQPTVDGYSAPPDRWLQAEVDLIGVEDMAVGNSIYLVYADGKLRKLSAGQPDMFDISDWDMPPNRPSAIFTRPPEETQAVYVADPGNSRIVQSDKEGNFERQFLLADPQVAEGGDPLSGVTSLLVDERIGHAYFLSGQGLYLIILPD